MKTTIAMMASEIEISTTANGISEIILLLFMIEQKLFLVDLNIRGEEGTENTHRAQKAYRNQITIPTFTLHAYHYL